MAKSLWAALLLFMAVGSIHAAEDEAEEEADVEKEDAGHAVSKKYVQERNAKEVEKLWGLDEDEDGKLTLGEVMSDPMLDSLDIMKIGKYMGKMNENFKTHDKDEDGHLDKEELVNFVNDRIEL